MPSAMYWSLARCLACSNQVAMVSWFFSIRGLGIFIALQNASWSWVLITSSGVRAPLASITSTPSLCAIRAFCCMRPSTCAWFGARFMACMVRMIAAPCSLSSWAFTWSRPLLRWCRKSSRLLSSAPMTASIGFSMASRWLLVVRTSWVWLLVASWWLFLVCWSVMGVMFSSLARARVCSSAAMRS